MAMISYGSMQQDTARRFPIFHKETGWRLHAIPQETFVGCLTGMIYDE